MVNELEGLCESLRAAMDSLRVGHTHNPAWNMVRDELIRLARENAGLRSRCNVFVQSTARFRGDAERAESECEKLRADADDYRDAISEAVGRTQRAESELAALRKRIEEAPVVEWSRYFDYGESSLVGKRVRLVEEAV